MQIKPKLFEERDFLEIVNYDSYSNDYNYFQS